MIKRMRWTNVGAANVDHSERASPMTTNVEARLQEVVDRREITDLVYRPGARLDEGRLDEGDAVHGPDAAGHGSPTRSGVVGRLSRQR